ncbi:hypothetical protein WJX81_004140 [Elliptochloris bilobata]|uniref:GST C-terminal domain-containing protein n=1 Tax=Elliptochloris bilobata TaxID=381761 RepID=A0AAW1RNG4_9CHLO
MEGSKIRTALEEMNENGDGAFKRKESQFRKFIEPGGRFPPEAGRYHLYISLACPWANRCLAVRNLKGLQDIIGLSVTHPTWQRTRPDDPNDEHTGWVFASPDDPPFTSSTGFGSFPPHGCIPDKVNGAKSVRELYEKAGDTFGKYTVPVLWDKKEGTIVNNESAEIVRMFNSAFNDFAKHPELDLYPEPLRKAIDDANAWIYSTINNGVYRCGFAQKQGAYEEAVKELFASLDRCEKILDSQKLIAGDALTEADLRLFMTLIRFDHVYVVYFKCDRQFIHQYPNLARLTRDVYHTPGMAEAVDLYHIKTHYFTSHPKLNYYAIVPVGPPEWWKTPA